MKTILKWVIGIIIVVVCWRAYQNGGLTFKNVGKEAKVLLDEGRTVVEEQQLIEKGKIAAKDLKEGFEENDSIK